MLIPCLPGGPTNTQSIRFYLGTWVVICEPAVSNSFSEFTVCWILIGHWPTFSSRNSLCSVVMFSGDACLV
jgi:hypothetical protein